MEYCVKVNVDLYTAWEKGHGLLCCAELGCAFVVLCYVAACCVMLLCVVLCGSVLYCVVVCYVAVCCGVLLYCVLPRSLASRLNGDSSVIVAISKQLYINKVKNIQKYFEQNKKLFLALFITASAVHTESFDKTINVVNDLTKKLLDEFCPYRSETVSSLIQ